MIRSIFPGDHAVSRSIAKYFAVTFIFCVALLLSGQTVAGQKVRLRSQTTPNCTENNPVISGEFVKYADVYADGNIAVLGGFECSGAFIFDITDRDHPVLASRYNPTGNMTTGAGAFIEAIVVGNRGYFGSGYGSVANGNAGVHIVDLSNPYNPVLLGIVDPSRGNGFTRIHEMMIWGDYLIENDQSGTNGLRVINISNPANPVFKWTISTLDNWVHAMHIRGNRLYTSGFNSGIIEIYDMTNIATQAPVRIGSITGNTRNHSSWTSEDGNYLYSCRELSNGDLRVYDIRNPAAPVLVRAITTTDLGLNAVSPHNPVVVGNRLYVSWYQAGTQVFDISDPTLPIKIAQYDTYSPAFAPPSGKEEKSKSELTQTEPWDVICGVGNLQQALPNTYDGNWAIWPFLGQNQIIAADITNGLIILDATGVGMPSKNVVSDFDGDKKTDLAVFRPSNGAWQIERSSDGFEAPIKNRTSPLGDDIVPGDYDGDGISELGNYKTSTSQWTVRKFRPTGSRFLINAVYGSPGDIPIAADYDADGKTDVAIWRPSNGTFQIWQSTLGLRTVTWAQFRGTGSTLPQVSTDKPLVGDYDGDGKIDLAVWRAGLPNGTLYINKSSSSLLMTMTLGQTGDKVVSADFDGNGSTDAVAYRPSNGTWYVQDPVTLASSSFVWGNPEDSPIPADYDGDGKADFTVFRPSTNQWLRINSSNGLTLDRVFGQPGDTPSPSSIQPN